MQHLPGLANFDRACLLFVNSLHNFTRKLNTITLQLTLKDHGNMSSQDWKTEHQSYVQLVTLILWSL